MAWTPILLVENAQQSRQTGTAVESFRNEMVAGNEKSMNILLQASNQVSSIPGITYGSR